MNTRQEGYYWVKEEGGWVIAEYGEFYDWLNEKKYGWHLPGKCEGYCENEFVCAPVYSDSDFSEINETRIPSPDEVTIFKPNPNTSCASFLKEFFKDEHYLLKENKQPWDLRTYMQIYHPERNIGIDIEMGNSGGINGDAPLITDDEWKKYETEWIQYLKSIGY